MKKIILLAVFIMAGSWLFAQDSEVREDSVKSPFGYYIVQTGINFSKFHSTADYGGYEPEFSGLAGFSAAFITEVPTNASYFYKQFGIRYSEMGSVIKQDDVESKVRIKYVTIPLLFNFKLGSPTFKVYAGFGGYVSLAFAGSLKIEDELVSEDILGWQYGDDTSPKYYHYGDAGLLFGGGFQYILPNKDGIQLSCHYGFGLVPIANSYSLVQGGDSFNPKEFTRNLNISVAYMFGKKLSQKYTVKN